MKSKKKNSILIIIITLILVGCSNKSNVSDESYHQNNIIDKDQGIEKSNSNPRIVAGSKTIAEYLAVFDQELVGVAEQKDLPSRYVDVVKVGSPRKLNLEMILSLKPDWVIANESVKKDIDPVLKNQKVETLYLDSSTYDSVFDNILTVGKLLGKQEKAETLISELKSKESSLKQKANALQGKSVVLLFGTGDNFQLMTEHTYLGNLLKLLGMENIAKDVGGEENKYLPFSLEGVVASNPDYILTLAHGNQNQAKAMFEEEFKKQLWKQVPAVQENKLFHLDDSKYPVTGNVHVMETLEALMELMLQVTD
ncbi:helical backbone metal receptor [Erysipelothrix aquatica]|uniref:helical backbone metal receptor n=1 Tax=Erysipelothrix aquatica TaxID=2683714 RepID=UPI00135AF7D6|nr:helical backbone metal receptor [Erysipelothrix aquatica]